MRKLVCAITVLIAAIFLMWSKSALVDQHTVIASTVGIAEPFETTSPILPFEITVKNGKNLPVEVWDAF